MKKGLSGLAALALVGTLLSQGAQAQEAKDVIVEGRPRNNGEQIIITHKPDSTGKTVIVIDGDKISLNGKPIEEGDGDVTVNRHKIRDLSAFSYGPGSTFSFSNDARPNSAMLGITSDKVEKGLRILTVRKESGADKAGLKKDDIITKIDGDAVESPDALTKKIRAHKPGEKIDVTYLRGGKTDKVTAELGKMDDVVISGFGNLGSLNFNGDFNRSLEDVQINAIPRVYGRTFAGMNGAPRLGLTVQDTDDGKGVKVLDVDDEGNAAKAGIEEDDIITEVDGKAVNGADEIAKVMRDSKDKTTVKFKYERDGKSNSVDVRVPRKLKTANL